MTCTFGARLSYWKDRLQGLKRMPRAGEAGVIMIADDFFEQMVEMTELRTSAS